MSFTLDLKSEHLSYTARFEAPLLELWGAGAVIAKGMYGAYLPFGVALANFQMGGPSSNAADVVVTVRIGDVGLSKFAFDRTESAFTNFSEEFFQTIPKLLAASTQWIRASIPSFKVASHHFAYFSHSLLKEGAVADYLQAVGPRSLKAGGESIGNGLIFNQLRSDLGWQTQLTVDRSISVPDGLFVGLNLTVKKDIIDYDDLLVEARRYFDSLIGELGLRLPDSSQ